MIGGVEPRRGGGEVIQVGRETDSTGRKGKAIVQRCRNICTGLIVLPLDNCHSALQGESVALGVAATLQSTLLAPSTGLLSNVLPTFTARLRAYPAY